MALGFDDLVEKLLSAVALAGDRAVVRDDSERWHLLQKDLIVVIGLGSDELNRAVASYYDEQDQRKTSDHTGVTDLLFSEAPPNKTTGVDENFVNVIWKWLEEHPDVEIKATQNSPPVSIDQGKPGSASGTDSRAAGVRIFVNEERIWQMIAGHGVDYKRIPLKEFQCLCVIAASGHSGCIQPDVTRLTGQDKRSVPKRTDNLCQKGYIVKEGIAKVGLKTTILKLKKFVRISKHADPEQPKIYPVIADANGNRLVLFEEWYDKCIYLLLENGGIAAMEDLREALGIRGLKWQTKVFRRCWDRLVDSGCVRRISAQVQGRNNFAKCVQLLREPKDHDRLIFGAEKERNPTKVINDAVNKNATETGRFDHSADNGKDEELEDLSGHTAPQWSPDLPLNNLVFNIIESAGASGISSMDLNARTTGLLFRRPLDEVMLRLTQNWQTSQPPHLRHLAIVKDAGLSGKLLHYVYRTHPNFEKAVEQGHTSWEAVQYKTKLPKGKKKAQNSAQKCCLDTWAFPEVDTKQFPLAGRAPLHDCGPKTNTHMKISNPTTKRLLDALNLENKPSVKKRKRSITDNQCTGQSLNRVHQARSERYSNIPTQGEATVAADPLTIDNEQAQEQLLGQDFTPRKPVAAASHSEIEIYTASVPRLAASMARAEARRMQSDVRDERIQAIASDLLERTKPGVYVRPPGSRALWRLTKKHVGRPKKTCIVVFRTPKLLGLKWFSMARGFHTNQAQQIASPRNSLSRDSLTFTEEDIVSATPAPPNAHASLGAPEMDVAAYPLSYPSEVCPPSLMLHEPAPPKEATVADRRNQGTEQDETSLRKSKRRRQISDTNELNPPKPTKIVRVSGEDDAWGISHSGSLPNIGITRRKRGRPRKTPLQIAPNNITVDLPSVLTTDNLNDELSRPDLNTVLGSDTLETDRLRDHVSNGNLADCEGLTPEPIRSNPDLGQTQEFIQDSNDLTGAEASGDPTALTRQNRMAADVETAKVSDHGSSNTDETPTRLHPKAGAEVQNGTDAQALSLPDDIELPNLVDVVACTNDSRKSFSNRPVIAKGMIRVRRENIIMDIIRRCNGVFPGNKEIWYPFYTIWRRKHAHIPDRRTLDQAILSLCHDGKLKRIQFEFRDKDGRERVSQIILEAHIPLDAPQVRHLQRKMIDACPRPHIPKDIDIAPGLLPRTSGPVSVGNLVHNDVDTMEEPEEQSQNHADKLKVDYPTVEGITVKRTGVGANTPRKDSQGQKHSSLKKAKNTRQAHKSTKPNLDDDTTRELEQQTELSSLSSRDISKADSNGGGSFIESSLSKAPAAIRKDENIAIPNGVDDREQALDDSTRLGLRSHRRIPSTRMASRESDSNQHVQSTHNHREPGTDDDVDQLAQDKDDSTTNADIISKRKGAPTRHYVYKEGSVKYGAAESRASGKSREMGSLRRTSTSIEKDTLRDSSVNRLLVATSLMILLCDADWEKENLPWNVLYLAMEERFDIMDLKAYWDFAAENMNGREIVKLMAEILQQPFLDAYKRGELESIDFKQPELTNWHALVNWAESQLAKPANTKCTRNSSPATFSPKDMPASRRAFQEHFSMKLSQHCSEFDSSLYFDDLKDYLRVQMGVAYPFGFAFPENTTLPVTGQEQEMDQELILLKSIARSIAMTDERNYDMEQAAVKMSSLGRGNIRKVTTQLMRTRTFKQAKIDRQRPGRNFQVSQFALSHFKRWQCNSDERDLFKEITAARVRIADQFAAAGEMDFSPDVTEAENLVLINMLAQGHIKLLPATLERNDDPSAQPPTLSAWGWGELNGQKRREISFPLKYMTTSKFTRSDGLQRHVKIPKRAQAVPGEPQLRIPFWIDFNGDVLDDVWDMVVRSILHLLVFRSGLNVNAIERAHNNKLWTWEAQLVLDWMEKVGIANKVGESAIDECRCDSGWTAGEWWYCVFLPDVIPR